MTKRSILFIDRLVLSFPLSPSEQRVISQRFPSGDSDWGEYLSGPRAKGGYSMNFRLLLGNAILRSTSWDADILDQRDNTRIANQLGASAYISLNPWQDRVRYLRIEFSPHAAGASGRQRMRRFLEELFGNQFDSIMCQAVVTRLDVGFDVYRLHVRDLLISRAVTRGRQSNGTRLFIGQDGELETIYTPLSSNRYLVLYDKFKEVNSKLRKLARLRGSRFVPYGGSRTRIEYRWRDLNERWVDVAQNLNNAFAQFTIQQYRRSSVSMLSLSERCFFDALKTRSLEELLHEVNSDSQSDTLVQRESLRRIVHDYPVPAWFNPEELWAELPQALERTGLLPSPEPDDLWGSGGIPETRRGRARLRPA